MSNIEKSYKCCGWSLVLAIILLVIACLTSCTTTKVVTVEKVRTDTTYITKHQRDSIWLHDSTLIREKGDTVRIERWHTKYVEREVHDTIYVARTDSVPVPIQVIREVEVEKDLAWWQKMLMAFGVIGVLIFLFWVWVTK